MKWFLMFLIFAAGIYYMVNKNKTDVRRQETTEQARQEILNAAAADPEPASTPATRDELDVGGFSLKWQDRAESPQEAISAQTQRRFAVVEIGRRQDLRRRAGCHQRSLFIRSAAQQYELVGLGLGDKFGLPTATEQMSSLGKRGLG